MKYTHAAAAAPRHRPDVPATPAPETVAARREAIAREADAACAREAGRALRAALRRLLPTTLGEPAFVLVAISELSTLELELATPRGQRHRDRLSPMARAG